MLDSRHRAIDSVPVPPVERVGLGELHDLFELACRRPNGWTAARRADHQLPLLVLKVADDAQRRQVVAHIARWCDSARPCRIPVARLSGVREAAEAQVSFRSELGRVHNDFRDIRYPQLRRFSFPRYELSEAVFGYVAHRAATGDAVPAGRQRDLRAGLLDYLAGRDALTRGMRVAGSAGDWPLRPWMAKFPVAALVPVIRVVIGVAAKPLLRWRLRTRLSSLGGQYYWFRKNINTNRGAEADPDFSNQVKFLLDNADQDEAGFSEYGDQQRIGALLEDLQHNYLRGLSPWRGWARTVYPVLILDDISRGSHRVELLNRINETRRAGGRWDPLLVVAVIADDDCYAELLGEVKNVVSTKNGEPRGAVACYRKWHSQFPGALQPYDQHAWFLFMSVHIAGRQDTQTDVELDTGSAIIGTRRRPRWTRGAVQAAAAAICAILLVGLLGWRHAAAVAASATGQRAEHARKLAYNRTYCAHSVLKAANQCVGVAPPGFFFGQHDWTSSLTGKLIPPGGQGKPGDVTVTRIERSIEGLNHTVDAESADGRDEPVVCIVYVGPVTLPGRDNPPPTDGVRELAGIYAAQEEYDNTGENNQKPWPLVRILIANAGAGMKNQYQVARQIVRLAEPREPIVGVVGIGANTKTTPQTLELLRGAGLPVVGTTISADTSYPYFFQLAPDDNREVQVGADYLSALQQHGPIYAVRIEDTATGYTKEIGDDLTRVLTRTRGSSFLGTFPYPGADASNALPGLARKSCRRTRDKLNLIYYLGRGQDLQWLLNGLAESGCASKNITIISGDDASRFSGSIPEHITLDYTALTFPPAWRTCYQQSGPKFYGDYEQLLTGLRLSRPAPGSPLDDRLLSDGHTVLGYDATTIMQDAATRAYGKMDFPSLRVPPAEIHVTRGAVWGQLRTVGSFPGASGVINFRPGYEKHKFVAVVHRGPAGGATIVFAEGRLTSSAASTCPGP